MKYYAKKINLETLEVISLAQYNLHAPIFSEKAKKSGWEEISEEEYLQLKEARRQERINQFKTIDLDEDILEELAIKWDE